MENLKFWKDEAKSSFEHLAPESSIENGDIQEDSYSDFAKNVEDGRIFADKLKSLENMQGDDGFLTAQERIKILSEIRDAAALIQGSKDYHLYVFGFSSKRCGKQYCIKRFYFARKWSKAFD